MVASSLPGGRPERMEAGPSHEPGRPAAPNRVAGEAGRPPRKSKPGEGGMKDDEIGEAIADANFFQDFEIAPGAWTGGPQKVMELLPRLWLPAKMDGLHVCDCGSNDGYFALECARRGAAEVLAVDHPDWAFANCGVRRKQGFELTMEAAKRDGVRGKIRDIEVDLESAKADEMIPSAHFDIILCMGVLYHCKHPLRLLERVAGWLKPGGTVTIETHVALQHLREPAALFYPGAEFAGDASNFWGPNPACVLGWLEVAGLAQASMLGIPVDPSGTHARAIFRAVAPP